MAFGNPPYNRSLYTTNKLLERYPYAIGVKTGYTDDAGLCLVTAAEKDGTRLIIVTLNGKDDVNTHMRLYEHFSRCWPGWTSRALPRGSAYR